MTRTVAATPSDGRLAGDPADAYPVSPDALPPGDVAQGRYSVRFATDEEDLDAVLRLRFRVFNEELGEGLDESWATGRDRDSLDAVWHHLLVEETVSREVVGTYRLQTAEMARAHLGFYSAGEFDLAGMPAEVLDHAVELGRACVAREHRNTRVLFALWRGLARYVTHNQTRFFFGCSSLTSQDPDEGKALMDWLEAAGHTHPTVRVSPTAEMACYPEGFVARRPPPKVPTLFRTYLRHGAKVCGPPAIDRAFKTIDYLLLFDVDAMSRQHVKTFFER